MLFVCDFFSLWQGSMSSSSSAKLVDCILALKSYYDWKQGGGVGFWRLKSPNHPAGNSTNSKFSRSKSMNNSSNSRKKWAILDQESLDDTSLASLSNEPSSFAPASSVSSREALSNGPSGENRSSGADREVTSNENSSAGTGLLGLFFWFLSTLSDQLSRKLSSILQLFHTFGLPCAHCLACNMQCPNLPGCNTLEKNFKKFFK